MGGGAGSACGCGKPFKLPCPALCPTMCLPLSLEHACPRRGPFPSPLSSPLPTSWARASLHGCRPATPAAAAQRGKRTHAAASSSCCGCPGLHLGYPGGGGRVGPGASALSTSNRVRHVACPRRQDAQLVVLWMDWMQVRGTA